MLYKGKIQIKKTKQTNKQNKFRFEDLHIFYEIDVSFKIAIPHTHTSYRLEI